MYVFTKALDGATTTGVGRVMTVIDSGTRHTIQIELTSGTLTALVVELQGSLGGDTWYQLAEHTATGAELTAGEVMFHVIDKPVIFLRLNVTTLTGSTPVLDAQYLASGGGHEGLVTDDNIV